MYVYMDSVVVYPCATRAMTDTSIRRILSIIRWYDCVDDYHLCHCWVVYIQIDSIG